MSQVHLSDVQLANLTMLLSIRDGIHQDRVRTCCRFGLDVDQAAHFATLGVHQIMAIVANVGNVTLFPPRCDLTMLLELPLPLTRPMATVHALRHSTPQ